MRALEGWRALLAAVLLAGAVHAADPPAPPRFFFTGDGVLDLDHAHFDERLHVRYRDGAGQYDPAALDTIARFFRSRTDGRSAPVSLRLIELIDYVQDRHGLTRLTLVSGYRSPELNAALRDKGGRVAQNSLHTEGMAADLLPADVNLRRLWVELRELRAGGVGLYAQDGFFHLDTGQPRFWEAATSGVEKNLSAGNARLFARTDFDRYADLRGALITLHSVTALPLRIAQEATIDGQRVTLAPADPETPIADGCVTFDDPAPRYALTVTSSLGPPAGRHRLVLRPCQPRIAATPADIATNEIEALTPHQ